MARLLDLDFDDPLPFPEYKPVHRITLARRKRRGPTKPRWVSQLEALRRAKQREKRQ